MHKNILVIADKDIDQHASMQKARAIAHEGTEHISIIGFIDSSKATSGVSSGQKDAALQKAIDKEFAGMKSVDYDVVVTDNIAHYCKTYTKENAVDLVIKTGNRSEKLFYTPLDWQLIRELSCPVMITTLQKWRARRNVMMTIDVDSEDKTQKSLNLKVARWAQEWAKNYGCDLHVAYCIHIREALTELDIVSKDEVMLKKERAVRDKLQAFLDDNDIECASIQIRPGQPDRVLPSLANKLKADIVVLGSVGRKGLKGMLLGNTAEKTLHKLRTDVAIIHPDK